MPEKRANTTSSNLPEKIRITRKFLNFTQQYMADQLNVSSEAYGKIERGKTSIHLPRLQQIAEILGVKPSQLLDLPLEELLKDLARSSQH